jgi:hypothetical protein
LPLTTMSKTFLCKISFDKADAWDPPIISFDFGNFFLIFFAMFSVLL